MNTNMPINGPYIGEIDSRQGLEDTLSKIYFTNIRGRQPKSRYVWKASGLSKERLIQGVENHVSQSGNNGVPHFFVSFPHVTVGYRWGDPRFEEQETNLYRVGLGQTPELENITIIPPAAKESCPDSAIQIGCPAELHIVGQERIIRAQSLTMEQYLRTFAELGRYQGSEVMNPNLVRESLIAR